MVLAAVADLMLSSRIRAAAAGSASGLEFARSSDEVLDRARTASPRVILLDLNGPAALDPVGTIRRLRHDPDLQSIRVVGFVSHVQSELIAQARAAGIDEVLARSAFVAKLPELLKG